MSFRIGRGVLLLALSAALSPGLAAQESQDEPEPAASAEAEPAQDPAEEEPPRFEETIEVEGERPTVPTHNLSAARMPASLMRTPASVSVVSEGLVEEQHGVVLGDALKNASGVNVATGFGVFDFFVIRGFDSLSSGLVLTDSAAEPEATFYPLYNLNRVEVLKGPSAFLYGANTLSGAINLLRKRPAGGRSGADVSFSYGSFQTVDAQLDGNVSSADGRLAARLNGIFRDSEAYRDDKQNRLYALNPALAWQAGPGTRLDLNLEYARSEFMPDTGIPVVGDRLPDVPRRRSYQSPFDSSEQDVLRFRLDLEHRIGSSVTIRDKVYYTDLDWQSDGTLILGVQPGAAGLDVARTMLLLDDRQKLLGNQLEALVRFHSGAVSHDLLVGLELQRYTDVFQQDVGFLPPIDLADPVETAPGVFPIPGLTTTADATSRVVAPYVVDRIAFSEKVELFAGARLDAIDYEDADNDFERDETQFNPMGGLVVAPLPSLSFYVSAASAFAPPSTQVVGERAPEESVQVEGGVKVRFLGGRGLATLAVYHLDKDNIAIPDQGVLRQLGDQRSRGVELEVAAETGDGWYGSLAYAFNDAELTRFTDSVQVALDPPAFLEVDYSGNAPPYAPRHIFSTWVTRRLAGGISLAAGVRHVGSQFIGVDNSFAIDSYWTADAMLAWERDRFRASVNFSNLTDTAFETRGFDSSAVIPADPFAVYARVRIGLGSN